MLSMLFLQVTEALRVVLQARLLTGIMCLVWGGRPSERAALLADKVLARPSWFASHSLSSPSPGHLAPHVAARPG